MQKWNKWQQQRSEARLKKVADMVKAGTPKVEIALRLKVSRVRLYQLIAKAKERGLLTL